MRGVKSLDTTLWRELTADSAGGEVLALCLLTSSFLFSVLREKVTRRTIVAFKFCNHLTHCAATFAEAATSLIRNPSIDRAIDDFGAKA